MKRITVLVLAQVPPPVHGAAVINKAVIDCLAACSSCLLEHENTSASRSISDMQKRNLEKLSSATRVMFNVFVNLMRRRRDVVYVNASPQGLSSYRDLFLILLACLRADRILVHFHGRICARSIFSRTFLVWILPRKIEFIFLDKTLIPEVFNASKQIHILQNFCPDEKGLSPLSGGHGSPMTVCFLANMLPAKGIHTVLDVCAVVLRSSRNLAVKIAGGWTRKYNAEDYQRWIDQNQDLAENFEHWGSVYGQEKLRFFNGCDIFLYPTKNDAFPLVVLEAMANGLAVIASNVGAIENIVGHSDFLSHPDDVDRFVHILEQLLDDPASLADEKSEMRQRYHKLFTRERFEEKLLTIIGV